VGCLHTGSSSKWARAVLAACANAYVRWGAGIGAYTNSCVMGEHRKWHLSSPTPVFARKARKGQIGTEVCGLAARHASRGGRMRTRNVMRRV
jgi:hypothetical protein